MHYYKFNIADYRKDTVHLSPMEHYIYRQLIDWYYLDESPIPKKTQSVLRRLSLGTEHEASLNNVLSDFFFEAENGWIHHRIDKDISEYQALQDKNRENGKKGGRPKKQEVKEDVKPNGNPLGSESEPSVKATTNHKPLTTNHKPKEKKPPRQSALDIPPGFDAFWSAYDKKVERPAAERAWKKAAITEAELPAIIAAARAYVAATPDKTFRKNPATWLNNRCWNDEVITHGTRQRDGNLSNVGNSTRAQRVEAELLDIARRDVEARSADGGGGGDLCEVLPALPAQVG